MNFNQKEFEAINTTSFRLYLQNELLTRCNKNPKYSLRSFARALEINPSSLSRILRNKRTISNNIKYKLGKRLGLSPIELSNFKEGKYDSNYENNNSIENNFNQLTIDTFIAISDWYHLAILELVKLKNFKPNNRFIAKAFDITVNEVNAAVERLIRLDLLKIEKDGKWINTKGSNTTVDDDLTHSAYRKYLKQILGLAIKALEEVPVNLRDQSSMTMSINTNRLPEAIEMITKFRRRLCKFLEEDKEKDEVYQLAISLYPLTNIKRKEMVK